MDIFRKPLPLKPSLTTKKFLIIALSLLHPCMYAFSYTNFEMSENPSKNEISERKINLVWSSI